MATNNNEITRFSQERESTNVSISIYNVEDPIGLADDVRKLKEINEKLDAKNNSLIAMNAWLIKEKERLNKSLTSRRRQTLNEIQDLKSTVISHESLINEKEKEIADVRRELKKNQKRVVQLEKQANERNTEIETFMREKAEFKLKVAALVVELETSEDIIRRERQASKDDIASLKEDMSSMNKDMSSMKEDMSSVKEDLNSLTQGMAELLETSKKKATVSIVAGRASSNEEFAGSVGPSQKFAGSEGPSNVSAESAFLEVKCAGGACPEEEVSSEDKHIRKSSKIPSTVGVGGRHGWRNTKIIPEKVDKSIGFSVSTLKYPPSPRRHSSTRNSKDRLPPIKK